MKRHFLLYILFSFSLIISSCTEPYALQTDTYEDIIVIEATITNELKRQEIKLSKVYQLEETGPKFEKDAIVFITDDNGNQYDFEESDDKYVSKTEFQASPNRTYQLHITTKEGKKYKSTNEKLTTVNNIEDIVPSVVTKEGIRGVEINVKNFDPTNTSKYYRYEYEETYKIITPYWDPETAYIIPPPIDAPPNSLYSIGLTPREGESKTCYSSDLSKEILLTTTAELSEDRVNFPVRFISNINPIITHRYSILVKQYIQSLAAYTFYETLKKFSGSDNAFSQNQPGFFSGNIRSENNPMEKVIGFFDVSSVSSKRVFFNREDLFPGEPLPPYFYQCEVLDMGLCDVVTNPECKQQQLRYGIESNELLYYDSSPKGSYTLYKMVIAPCGDCTTFSSNIKPAFWID